jgi:transposase
MSIFLAACAETIPDDVHMVMALDQAGWHRAYELNLPENITLVSLPPYSPELNPVEWVWLYLRERYLSVRVCADQNAMIDACCQAWNKLANDVERVKSLCLHPWIETVIPN